MFDNAASKHLTAKTKHIIYKNISSLVAINKSLIYSKVAITVKSCDNLKIQVLIKSY